MSDSAVNLGYDSTNTKEIAKYNSLPSNCAIGVINLSVTDGTSNLN